MFPCRAGEGRRLEHDELALGDHAGERARGVQQRAEVGLAVARQRRRDADEDRLGLVQLDEARGERAALEHRAEALGRDVLDVRAALAQRGDLRLVDVDADHVDAGLGEADRQRQPDVAHAHDADAHGRETVAAAATGRRNSARQRGPGSASTSLRPRARRARTSRARRASAATAARRPGRRPRRVRTATTSSVPRGATNAPTRAIARERTDSGSDCTVSDSNTNANASAQARGGLEQVGDDVVDRRRRDAAPARLAPPSARRRTR